MATKQIIMISGDVIDESELRQFCDSVEHITGAIVSMIPLWRLESDDQSVMDALAGLLCKLDAEKPARKTKTGAGIHIGKTQKEIKSWQVYLPDVKGIVERLTISERDSRLAAGKFEEGTLVRHPKVGWQRVEWDGDGTQMLVAMDAKDVPNYLQVTGV